MTHNAEEFVAKAVYVTSLAERALHGDGVWSMRIGEVQVPASSVDGQPSVVAYFPPLCWIKRPVMIALIYNGEVQSYRDIQPSDEGFTVTWTFEVVLASAA